MKRLSRRKSHVSEHIDSEGSWAISYGDMITLLLSFFVLYFTVDLDKVAANQLQESLMVRLQEKGVKAMNDGLKAQMNIGPTPGEGVDIEVMQKFGAKVTKDKDHLIVEFQNISFFDIGEVDLNSNGSQALNEFAKIYVPYSSKYNLNIQAFTDVRKVVSQNRRYRDNLELSALRSVAAVRTLQKAGMPLARMKTSGYGELMETQEKLMKLQKEKDPMKYTRTVVLVISPAKERN